MRKAQPAKRIRSGAAAACQDGGMYPIDSAVCARTLSDFAKDHVRRYLASKGREGHLSLSGSEPKSGEVPSLLLMTRGRRSGRRYLTPLYYGSDAGRYVLIASKEGAPDHPGWYKNLSIDPEVRIQVGAKRMDAKATTTKGAERTRLWKLMESLWPGYRDYQAKTRREIPVVLLTPKG
jgi:proline iminopeptidase